MQLLQMFISRTQEFETSESVISKLRYQRLTNSERGILLKYSDTMSVQYKRRQRRKFEHQ